MQHQSQKVQANKILGQVIRDPPRYKRSEHHKKLFQEIGAILGVDRDEEELRSRVIQIVNSYLRSFAFWCEAPRGAETKQGLRQISRETKSLTRTLKKLYESNEPKPRVREAVLNLLQAPEYQFSVEKLVGQLVHLEGIAERALATLSNDKGGRLRDLPFEFLVADLASLYYDKTNRRASVSWDQYDQRCRGPFFDLVERCLSLLGSQYNARSNQALGQAIKRALRSQ